MGNRALQMVTLIVAVAVGVGAAYGVRAVRSVPSQQASSTSSTGTPSASADLSPSPTPSASPSAQASPSPAPSPTVAPSSTPTRPAAGAAAYPAQLQAGSTYSYSGSGQLAVLASDGQDSGTSICAGITNTSQAIPTGYFASYFVSVAFPDGNILSAGYLRQGSTSTDFGQIQAGSAPAVGNRSTSATGAGTHTYCVARSGSAWVMTADGGTVASTTAEPATSTSGATLHFESTIQRKGSSTTVPLAFVVPGFSGLSIDGRAPTQLTGSISTF